MSPDAITQARDSAIALAFPNAMLWTKEQAEAATGLCSKTLCRHVPPVKIGRSVRWRPAIMPYKVILESSENKALSKLPVDVQRRIVGALHALALVPRPQSVVKMTGDDNRWRVRVGKYRIVYKIHDERLMVLVLRVAHRREVYR